MYKRPMHKHRPMMFLYKTNSRRIKPVLKRKSHVMLVRVILKFVCKQEYLEVHLKYYLKAAFYKRALNSRQTSQ